MKKTAYITTIFLSLFVFFAFAKNVSAQDTIPLTVAPARQYLSVDPGGNLTSRIKFFNHGQFPVSGEIKVVDFIVNNSSGSPVLLEDENFSSRFSAASWAKTSVTKATIAKESVLEVPFTVDVPDNARPGGRYLAVIFEASGQVQEPQTPETEGISSVNPRVVGLVSIRINGPITEGAFVDVFKVPGFIQFGPVPVYFEIFNNGDYHITPNGSVTITNWFNKQVGKYNLEEKNIFPDARRSYETELGKTWMFGRYKVDLVASYGESGQVVTATDYVWVLPIFLIIAIILGIAIMVMGTILIVKKVKTKQEALEAKLEREISEVEQLKNKFKDQLPKGK